MLYDSIVAARKTRAIPCLVPVCSRGRLRQSQALVFLALRLVLQLEWGLISGWSLVPYGTARGEPASTTDEKPALASAGLIDQVELRRPYPPSSRC